jgi:hypothetical protein
LDSGGFSELSLYGTWRTSPAEYVRAIVRYRDEIGSLAWAAPQDWMCEPPIIAKTGRSVGFHQAATVASVLELRVQLGPLVIPVLQGWDLGDYVACAERARHLASADSMAWSYTARRQPPMPGCPHRSCANCPRFALAWRDRVLRRVATQQLSLFDTRRAA